MQGDKRPVDATVPVVSFGIHKYGTKLGAVLSVYTSVCTRQGRYYGRAGVSKGVRLTLVAIFSGVNGWVSMGYALGEYDNLLAIVQDLF